MAKCKNCKQMIWQKVDSTYTTTEYPHCNVFEECIDDIDKEIACNGFESMTNAERIRSMTDEELEEYLWKIAEESPCYICAFRNGWLCEKPYDVSCHGGISKWLKSEVGCE